MSRIAAVKAQVDIVVLIEQLGGRVEGERHWGGRTLRWIPTACPFHMDQVASASINQEAGRFTCHGCGVRGDVIDLAKMHLGIEGKEDATQKALDWLASEFGVTDQDAPVPVRRWR